MKHLVVFGPGELGRWFGGAALAEGMRVTPIVRGADPHTVLADVALGTPILMAVGEDALERALDALPSARRDALVLLQNELWPRVWQTRAFAPSLILPWVLQKQGAPRIVVGTTPVYGAHAPLLTALCKRLALPHAQIGEAELPQALADKYAFILTINALGCWRDETLGTFLSDARAEIGALCREACALSAGLLGARVDAEQSHRLTLEAMTAMAQIRARGRTARTRVERALAHAAALGLDVPALRACANAWA